jgi:hypothetical protein
MADNGYMYGTAFQKQLLVESTTGKMQSRSLVSMEPPPSPYGQSHYPIHPACIDGCFQTLAPALWAGDKSTVGAALVPSVLSSIVIAARAEQPTEAISCASGRWLGIGRTDSLRNYGGSCSVYDPNDGSLLLQLKDLVCAELEATEDEGAKHTFTRLAWAPDISMLLSGTGIGIRQYLAENGKTTPVQDLLDLVAHKHPVLRVLEINLNPDDSSSCWVQDSPRPIRSACSQYHLAVNSGGAVVASQQAYAVRTPNAGFSILDLSKGEAITPDVRYDLAIVKGLDAVSPENLGSLWEMVSKSSQQDSLVLAVGSDWGLQALGNTHALGDEVYICQRGDKKTTESESVRPKMTCVTLLGKRPNSTVEVLGSLHKSGWDVELCDASESNITSSCPVLILDELTDAIMDSPTPQQWAALKHLIEIECHILWVTCGAQRDVTDPDRAAVTGLLRTIRAESSGIRLINLDVGEPAGPSTVSAISACLDVLVSNKPWHTKQASIDSEYVERGGVISIGRLLPDSHLTEMQSDEPSQQRIDTLDLHATETTIRLRTERVGNIESIRFGELASEPIELADNGNGVEVEIYAAGMNYKDVVVSMGIVPGDEYALGGEASGVIRRIGSDVTGFNVGDRVVVVGKGNFANRVQTTAERIHKIPDWMSFEEAATLCVVYLTAIYSLFDMANLAPGMRILIHSAAGGVGIAAIQLARYVGAEVSEVRLPLCFLMSVSRMV